MKNVLLLLALSVTFTSMTQVLPLLSTTWNQTCYYNASVPAVGSGGSCGNAYTGCNATAMAQICKYYAYPTTGFGSHCNSNFPTECADYSAASYNYAAMPNNVSSANMEVATLMYDLGVSVDMNWNGTNSTSFFDSKVLKKHFAYSPKLYATAIFLFGSTAELIAGIKQELDAGRPVYAKGGGHFYLIDGYNASDEFHMNFGWGGTYDGYYPIDAVVTPAGTFTPSNFMFYITPLADDLETAKDTLYVSATGSASLEVEFTSLSNWTMSSSEAWMTPALTSGVMGYVDSNEGSTVEIDLNNGAARMGYLIISNASETDTIVVVQDESPLTVTPNPMNFVEAGGTETISIDYSTWGTWTATTTETWLTLSSNSGTGPDDIDVICDPNTGNVRSAYVVVSGGAFVDSVLVWQDGLTAQLSELENVQIEVVPNPTEGFCTIRNLPKDQELFILDVWGQVVMCYGISEGSIQIDLRSLPSGVYIAHVQGNSFRILKR